MKSLFVLFAFVFAGVAAHATVDSSDLHGEAHLQVTGAKTSVTVKFMADYPVEYRFKLFYDSTVMPKCDGTPALNIKGKTVDETRVFPYTSMGGSLMYATVCVYSIVEGQEYLVRVLSDYDFAQGFD